MSATDLLDSVRSCGVELLPEGDRLRYRGPTSAVTPALLGELRQHKAELLAALDQEARAIPVLEIRTLVRTEAGVEVVEVTSGGSSHRRWEKRLCFGGACALVGEVTTDPRLARIWVKALQAADSSDGGVA